MRTHAVVGILVASLAVCKAHKTNPFELPDPKDYIKPETTIWEVCCLSKAIEGDY